ncbi:MAG: hypothetical protein JWP20_1600 [Roseomonas sp.]|nr:hypothetical protein [Roseomonas sp.]
MPAPTTIEAGAMDTGGRAWPPPRGGPERGRDVGRRESA